LKANIRLPLEIACISHHLMNNNDTSNRKPTDNNNKYQIEIFVFGLKRKLRNADLLTYFRQKNCSPHFENEKSKLTQ